MVINKIVDGDTHNIDIFLYLLLRVRTNAIDMLVYHVNKTIYVMETKCILETTINSICNKN